MRKVRLICDNIEQLRYEMEYDGIVYVNYTTIDYNIYDLYIYKYEEVKL